MSQDAPPRSDGFESWGERLAFEATLYLAHERGVDVVDEWAPRLASFGPVLRGWFDEELSPLLEQMATVSPDVAVWARKLVAQALRQVADGLERNPL